MAGAVVFAQERRHGHHHHDLAGEMKKELSLNDDQYQRVKSVEESYRVKFQELRADSTKSKEEKGAAMRSLGAERRKAVEDVLTPDQKTTWLAAQASRREQHKADFKKASADRAQKLKTDLSLSDKQFEKVQAGQKTFHEKASQLRKQSLTDEQRKAEFSKLRDEYRRDMKSILSKEQYKKLTEMNSHRKRSS